MFWKDKRVLVTGGHGFVGSHLVDRVNKLDAKATGLVRETIEWYKKSRTNA